MDNMCDVEEEILDKVSSEVHSFSKEEILDDSPGDDKQTCESESGKCKEPDEEELEYECLLGANGQVVLWSPNHRAVLSRFEFAFPSYMVEELLPNGNISENLQAIIDEDGDLDVVRRGRVGAHEGAVIIEHCSSTTLDLVGEQVWRGALFLADFLLHHPEVCRGQDILEVASGVGLTSIVAGMIGRKVIITDVDRGDILDLVRRNVKRNGEVLKANMLIREIDFFNHGTLDDIRKELSNVSVILAADVVYHNQLTDAFFETVYTLMSKPPCKTMYIALEKRYVFTIEDMDTVAPCYEYFKQCLDQLTKRNSENVSWSVEEVVTKTLPQYFTYERNKHLVLWKIRAEVKDDNEYP
ncbi:methyltransferase-like protein 22 isoform X2 [Oratosquilla oratoria]|uniref:methyltransferase-like protein 22 isoform X2 n=1 Tax=Oratosquilla oratoria TaxID=337810 RepID=UPI003F759513